MAARNSDPDWTKPLEVARSIAEEIATKIKQQGGQATAKKIVQELRAPSAERSALGMYATDILITAWYRADIISNGNGVLVPAEITGA